MPDDNGAPFDDDSVGELDGPLMAEPPHPINWDLLNAEEAEAEWVELNRWVNWLRRTYGFPATVVPPFWHRHPALVWELSALHLHWLCAYDPDQHGSAPFGWHRDFADARQRLHDWIATSGRRLDRDVRKAAGPRRQEGGWTATGRRVRRPGPASPPPNQSTTRQSAIATRTSWISSPTTSAGDARQRLSFTPATKLSA